MSKIYLDKCHNCGESKAAIKYSQSHKDPIFCGAVDYYGECLWEADRHVFVVTDEMLEQEKIDEEAYIEQMGDMVKFMEREAQNAK